MDARVPPLCQSGTPRKLPDAPAFLYLHVVPSGHKKNNERETVRPQFECLLFACMLLLPASLRAQDEAAWRGAWLADQGDGQYVLYLVLRDGAVTGTWCHDCADPANVAFVDDSAFDAAGLHFNLYSSAADGTNTVVPVDARLDGGQLHLVLNGPESARTELVLRRGPAWVEPPPRPAAPAAPARARELPGAPQMLTPDTIAGLWLTGSGPGKQYFIFKRHKDSVRGLVCGPCDNPHNFAPLENARIDGTRFHFDIVHEDNGFGFAQYGPFRNVTVAQIAGNEMQMTTYASYEPDGRKFELTLLGPVRYMPAVQP